MKGILTILLIAAAIGLLGFVGRPLWGEIEVLRAQERQVDDALSGLQELQELRQQLNQAYNAVPRTDLARLREFLPVSPESGALLVTLERLTNERGVDLKKIEFAETSRAARNRARSAQAEAVPAGTPSLTYTISFTASYETFKALLLALERSLRLVDVTNISFTSGDVNSYEFTLQARSYYLSAPNQPSQ